MTCPSLTEYVELAAEHDIVPVCRELLADTETPVSVLQRFADRQNAFLLESVEGGETWGRYSFVGVDPELLLETDHSGGPTGEIEALRDFARGLRVAAVPGVPRFFGGVVGFMGYEAVVEFEKMPAPRPSRGHVVPRSRFLRADCVVVFDNIRHTVKVIYSSRPAEADTPADAYRHATEQVDAVCAVLAAPMPHAPVERYPPVTFRSNMEPREYKDIVSKAKEYICAGDIIQVVLSQRFEGESRIPPVQLYRALRLLNPSPYMFFLKTGDQTLVGSSPEVMVRLTGRHVELRPIAGTRPRGGTEEDDRRLGKELLADEKERAEHVMLVDLGRNDVGRVAETGSVEVTEYMVIERYSHVMHLVSHVEGVLRAEFDAYDLIKATFPAGTLSGAPKIRAMEIIHELEPAPRGAYGGALGYISYGGNMDLAITIRTLEVAEGVVSVQAGAGVVHDSDPQREFEETCHKAEGMRKAVQMAAEGLEISDR